MAETQLKPKPGKVRFGQNINTESARHYLVVGDTRLEKSQLFMQFTGALALS